MAGLAQNMGGQQSPSGGLSDSLAAYRAQMQRIYDAQMAAKEAVKTREQWAPMPNQTVQGALPGPPLTIGATPSNDPTYVSDYNKPNLGAYGPDWHQALQTLSQATPRGQAIAALASPQSQQAMLSPVDAQYRQAMQAAVPNDRMTLAELLRKFSGPRRSPQEMAELPMSMINMQAQR